MFYPTIFSSRIRIQKNFSSRIRILHEKWNSNLLFALVKVKKIRNPEKFHPGPRGPKSTGSGSATVVPNKHWGFWRPTNYGKKCVIKVQVHKAFVVLRIRIAAKLKEFLGTDNIWLRKIHTMSDLIHLTDDEVTITLNILYQHHCLNAYIS
jgi:hypothetical protein